MKSILLLVLLISINVFSLPTYRLAGNSSLTVDEFSVCKVLTNTSANPYMVPTGLSNDWSTFLTHIPTRVSAAPCPTCSQTALAPTRTESNCYYQSNAVCATQVRPVDRYCDNDFSYCNQDSCTFAITCTHTYTYAQRVACCIDASTADCDNPPSP